MTHWWSSYSKEADHHDAIPDLCSHPATRTDCLFRQRSPIKSHETPLLIYSSLFPKDPLTERATQSLISCSPNFVSQHCWISFQVAADEYSAYVYT